MKEKYKLIFFLLFTGLILAVVIALIYMHLHQIAVLSPKGLIALKERDLIVISSILMSLVVIPVFIMATLFAWKYRASNRKATYAPTWDHSLIAETIWWGVPFIIILILAHLTWTSSHELDPFTPIASDKKPMNVQVVALPWKWLFIYPDDHIATINFLQIPEQRPVRFELTADAPMNSFWIPQLGGQVYAMPGMRTELQLMANETGSFAGRSANLSGEGFAGMSFLTKASSEEEFNQWVQSVKSSPQSLNRDEYEQLAKPSINQPAAFFSLGEQGLFDRILMKYMTPTSSN